MNRRHHTTKVSFTSPATGRRSAPNHVTPTSPLSLCGNAHEVPLYPSVQPNIRGYTRKASYVRVVQVRC